MCPTGFGSGLRSEVCVPPAGRRRCVGERASVAASPFASLAEFCEHLSEPLSARSTIEIADLAFAIAVEVEVIAAPEE